MTFGLSTRDRNRLSYMKTSPWASGVKQENKSTLTIQEEKIYSEFHTYQNKYILCTNTQVPIADYIIKFEIAQ